MSSFIDSFRYTVLLLLIALMAASFHPSIVSMSVAAGYESGTILSRYILLLFALLFVLSLSTDILKGRFIKKYLLLLLVIFLTSITVLALFDNKVMLDETRAILITFAALVIGWNLPMKYKKEGYTLIIFAFLIFAAGLLQIFQNIGGFVIDDQYLVDNKNSLGAMVATAASCMFFLFIQNREFEFPRFMNLISLLGFFLGLLILLTIRARASLLAVLVVCLYIYFLKSKRGSHVFIALVLLLLFTLIAFAIAPDSVRDYIYQSFFAGSQGEDVSSGRVDTYSEAIEYFFQNPLLGNITGDNKIGWVHNYPLLNIYQFGMIFSLPILYLYFSLLVFCLKRSYRQSFSINSMGFVIMLIPMTVSLLEPTFPFGPGTVTVINFIFLGVSLKQEYLKNRKP